MNRVGIFYFLFSAFCILLIGCSKESPNVKGSEFKPPEDGKITTERANVYVKASNYLMEAISKHEKNMQGFAKRYGIGEDLAELSDSTYCNEHPDIVTAWERLQGRWHSYELEAYKKAKISEEEFNWIGGALADTVNTEMQIWIQDQLQKLYK